MAKNKRPILWGGLLLLLVVVAIVYFSIPLRALLQFLSFDHIVEIVKSTQSNTKTMVIFYLCFVFGVMGLPITIFPVIGGVLFSFSTALVLNTLAATIGALFSFWVTRFVGRGVIASLMKGKLKSLDRFTSAEGIKTVLILRLLGVPPFIVTNYALGLSGIKTRHFILGTCIGIFPWMTFITFAAHSLWAAALIGGEKGFMSAVFSHLGPLMIVSLLIAIAMIGTSAYKKKLQKTDHSNL